MEITDSFRVSTPIDETWKVLLDLERIAPCMPGAQLQEVEGDEYRGIVKVKVGPITAQYKGAARIADVDEPNRRVVLDASGRDTRGQGNAKATIVVQMAEDGGGTKVDVNTDLQITGKVAQFGRGVLVDVSTKLLGQFVESLERDVLTGNGDGAAPADAGAASRAGEPTAGGAATATAPTQTSAPVEGATPSSTATPATGTGPRRIESREAEPIDLLDAAGAPLGKRLVPLALGALVLFVLWRLLRHK
jgi:carbon monoxide dehydrogenase subunit G